MLPWLPFADVTRSGMVTVWPLVKVAWHAKVVPTFASTSPGQSTDFDGGRSVSCWDMNLCKSETTSGLSIVVVPDPVENEAEHPAVNVAIAQIASAVNCRADGNRFVCISLLVVRRSRRGRATAYWDRTPASQSSPPPEA